jgi:hypothetical protein
MNTLTTEIIGDIKRVPDHQQLGGHTINTDDSTTDRTGSASAELPLRAMRTCMQGRLFHLTSVDMLHESVPVQSWNVLCFEDKTARSTKSLETEHLSRHSREDVTKYMSARFDTTSTYCFNPDLDIGTDGLLRQDLYGGYAPKWGHGLQRVGDEMGLVPIRVS